jgi:predicted translin family RNA/ssDNA-binding protein
MNAKERMFHSIEHVIGDITKMQDIVIKLTREIHELHVSKEHEAKLSAMKEQVNDLKKQMDTMQEFLYSCERPTEYKERGLSEIDVAL